MTGHQGRGTEPGSFSGSVYRQRKKQKNSAIEKLHLNGERNMKKRARA